MKRRALAPALLALVLTSCPGCVANQCLPGEIPVFESRTVTDVVSRLPGVPRGGISGVTIGRWIFVDPAAAEDERLLCHERDHVAQYDSLGVLFFVEYAWESVAHGYRANRFEVAADVAAKRC